MAALGTWIGPESDAYPTGALRDSRRRGRVLCADGKVRAVVLGIPDTYFSIPARVKVRGRTVSGYVGALDMDGRALFVFRAYAYGKNHLALPTLITDREWIGLVENIGA